MLKPIDFEVAADIAKNSIPCTGTLKTGSGAMCIMGCLTEAYRRRRKVSWRKAEEHVYVSQINGSSSEVVEWATGGKFNRDGLVGDNDTQLFSKFNVGLPEEYFDKHGLIPFYAELPETKEKIKTLRNWQVKTLKRMAKAARKHQSKK